MHTKNTYWIVAGALNLATFFLHLIGGQLDLVDPLLDTPLVIGVKSQLIGAWHMITILLLVTSLVLLYAGLRHRLNAQLELITFIGFINLLFCVPFVVSGFYYGLWNSYKKRD